MSNIILTNAKEKMEKSLESLHKDLASVRTGRANASMLDKVQVDYYGSLTPVNQVASVSVVEGRQLLIKPYDVSSIQDIEQAITKSNLGLTPQSDGQTVRLNIPALTEERRKEFVKLASKHGEDAKVAIRNVRRDANDAIKKDADISEDESKRLQTEIQKYTDDFIKKIDESVSSKQDDIMTV